MTYKIHMGKVLTSVDGEASSAMTADRSLGSLCIVSSTPTCADIRNWHRLPMYPSSQEHLYNLKKRPKTMIKLPDSRPAEISRKVNASPISQVDAVPI